MRLVMLGGLLPIAVACASSAGPIASSPYVAECPAAASTPGYPVVAMTDQPDIHAFWLRTFANAAAYRWVVPSGVRGRHAQWRAVKQRVLPPEPRWADDWKPDARHTAVVAVTLHRDGRTSAPIIERPSGDRAFDESLLTIFEDPLPVSPDFPALPAAAGDSLRVVIAFGEEPAVPDAGIVRFAAHQTPVEVTGGLRIEMPFVTTNLRRPPPPPPTIVTKYDVDANGNFLPETFEVLVGDGQPLAQAVREGLMRAQFRAARSNCRPIALTVLQVFGR